MWSAEKASLTVTIDLLLLKPRRQAHALQTPASRNFIATATPGYTQCGSSEPLTLKSVGSAHSTKRRYFGNTMIGWLKPNSLLFWYVSSVIQITVYVLR
jgi:hypothetical protein